ncbi:NERD domain-containing protein [Mycoplasma iguanae]|uniref:NERD domain-containing protein n=1 Tax=Mycoplasma iguanae TaxID=292461 RepID=A0ABY5R9F1_9MOLU|nr:nuclease-related domain-containing protein [Mycoplasma iguanae]UVD81956.1 NERD domain-containing protein [Mycoplasma iguanae]
MEVFYIIFTILGLLVFLFLLTTFIYLNVHFGSQKSEIYKIGKLAEVEISQKLEKWAQVNNSIWIDGSLYKINKNILFEIDGILITSRAVIVVEMKSMSGTLLGIGNQPKLIKKIHDKEFEINNPIIQNEKHIDHILNVINKRGIPILSMIIYADRIKALRVSHVPEHVLLIKESEISDTMWEVYKNLKITMSKQDMKKLQLKILAAQTKNKKDQQKFELFYN